MPVKTALRRNPAEDLDNPLSDLNDLDATKRRFNPQRVNVAGSGSAPTALRMYTEEEVADMQVSHPLARYVPRFIFSMRNTRT
jgi:hypothetical protein